MVVCGVRRPNQTEARETSMGIIVFCAACVALLWALLLLAVSAFFRGMALIALGATLLNIASHDHYPIWMLVIGGGFLLLPLMTVFRRAIFGE
jgi:hypothetical protein